MATVKMGAMTVQEVRTYLKTKRTIIFPYGVVEQHGYHLPLDTDIRNGRNHGCENCRTARLYRRPHAELLFFRRSAAGNDQCQTQYVLPDGRRNRRIAGAAGL